MWHIDSMVYVCICDIYNWSVICVWYTYDVCYMCIFCMVQGVSLYVWYGYGQYSVYGACMWYVCEFYDVWLYEWHVGT